MKGKSLFIALAMIVLGGSMIATSSCKKEKNQVIEVTGIELGESSVEMTVGTSHKLTATVLPENATEKGVVWESKDESVATVDQEGLVSAVKEGSTQIIVSTANGNFSAYCSVTVKKTGADVSGITIDKDELKLTVGNSFQLTATVLPENATEKGVVWESKDESIASVDQEGLVSAVKEGSTQIIASTANGNFSAVCNVIIEKELVAVTSITLDKDVIELMVGSKYQFKATVLPDNATNKTLIWSSDDEQIAMVSSSGVVMALKEGAATIYVQSLDKKVSASCDVFVEKAKKLELTRTSGTIGVGDKLDLVSFLLFEGEVIDPSKYSVKSDKPEIALVDENSKIVGKAAGKATITAMYEVGLSKIEANFELEVEDSFVSFIEDVFSISGRGTVVTTTVRNGTVRIGDEVKIIQTEAGFPDYYLTVKAIELYRKTVESATVGDEVGIMFNEPLDKNTVKRGAAFVARANTRIGATQTVHGTLAINSQRKTPLFNGYSPDLSAEGQQIKAKLTDLAGNELLMKETTYHNIGFTIPNGNKMVCCFGMTFNVMEGGKTIATFTVKDFTPMDLSFITPSSTK